MKKITMIALMLTMALGVNAQLLYKISGNGLSKPSYVFGTYHIGNIDIVNKVPGVFDALTETDQVYGEVKYDDISNADSAMYMQNAMLLPEGKTLKDYLSADDYARLNKWLFNAMGNDLNANSPMTQQMARMTPLAMVNVLQLLLHAKYGIGRVDPTTSLDKFFQEQAKNNNEPIGGLETVKFQSDLLFQSTPLERQAKLLMCLIDNEEFNVQILRDISNAYKAQDLDAIQKALDMKLNNSCDSSPEEEAAVLYNRNADWIVKMKKIMAEKPTFFAVGAGHLPGEKGLLQMLREEGYTIEGMK